MVAGSDLLCARTSSVNASQILAEGASSLELCVVEEMESTSSGWAEGEASLVRYDLKKEIFLVFYIFEATLVGSDLEPNKMGRVPWPHGRCDADEPRARRESRASLGELRSAS